MSVTLYALIAAAAPVALEAVGNFVKENRVAVNSFLKQSKPAIREVSKKLDGKIDEEVNRYSNDGWEKDK